ncbi:MAG: peptide chain release factor N(5)-glutamine methyltransferase [Gaiella sp.]
MLPAALTVGEVLRRSTEHLAAKGASSPRLDAERLLGKALGLERIELYMYLDRPLTDPELSAARGLVARRAAGEPLQHVLGEWGFRHLTLTVDARGLIPRPETEIVVERCLRLLTGTSQPRVLDVGTGSGAIALALADEHPGAAVTGTDVSPDALALAAVNVERTGLAVDLILHDLAAGLPPGPWELVVSNPPYVDPGDAASLEPEVRTWEPAIALYGVGLHETIARAARDVLVPGGALVLEVGERQGDDVCGVLAGLGYTSVTMTPDLAGRPRVVEGLAVKAAQLGAWPEPGTCRPRRGSHVRGLP